MPVSGSMLGTDYNYYLPYLLAGEQWIRLHGFFKPAWFTPGFCAGMPWLANPESMQWSLPQVLFLWLGPIGAVRCTYASMLLVGGAATWALLRRSFAASAEAAALGSVLFLLNGFLYFRMSIGHLTYHVIGLVPLLALLVLPDASAGCHGSEFRPARVVGAGAIMAEMVFAGAPNFVPPAVLSVVAAILLRQTRTGLSAKPWILLVGGCLWASLLAAIKLVPSLALILQFPRTYLNRGLFSDPIHFASTLVRAFFAPGLLPDSVEFGPDRWVTGRHEFEFGLGILPAALILVALCFQLTKPRMPKHPAAWAALFIVSTVPMALTLGPEGWERALAAVPILNNNTILTRWWAVWLLPLLLAGALSLDSLAGPRWRLVVLAAGTVLAILQVVLRDTGYYRTDGRFLMYNLAPVARAHIAIRNGGSLPPITAIGPSHPDPAQQRRAPMDGLLHGISSLPCYEAVFGYNSEWIPPHRFGQGPIILRSDGFLNMADPRCYLSWAACPPGTSIAGSDVQEAALFTAWQGIAWQQPAWQVAAAVTSGIAWVISSLALGWTLVRLCGRIR
jgi:hypothetical protein